MKFNFRLLASALFSVSLALSMAACSGGGGSSGNASSNTSGGTTTNSQNNASTGMALTQTDTQNLSQFMEQSIVLDIQAFEPSNIIHVSSNGDVSFEDLGNHYEAPADCVTVTNDTSGDTEIYVYSFACTNINGNIEINVTSTNNAVSSVKIVKELTLTPPSCNNSNSSATESDVSTTTASLGSNNVLTVTRTFDDTILDMQGDTYVAQGSVTDAITPNSVCNPCDGGTVSLTGTFTLTKNGSAVGTFTVSSSGLAYNCNGLDAGDIQIQDSTDDVVITFSGCGKITVTDNGQNINCDGNDNGGNQTT